MRYCGADERADRAIYCSTRGDIEIEGALRFAWNTPVPLKNLYATPETLGGDRLAAAVGAAAMFPGENLLVVDLGTAITFDIVADGAFLGGNISPGAQVRFRALNEFTGKLPLMSLDDDSASVRLAETRSSFPADNTADAIRSGVTMGIVAEAEAYFETARERYGVRRAIFTGGDANYFANRVNFPIFVASELVLSGLNVILNYNA